MKHLSYKMCCELKEAGFVQDPWHFGYYTIAEGSWGHNFETGETTDHSGKHAVCARVPNIPDPICACPTLEKLIEACGIKFKALRYKKIWQCLGFVNQEEIGIELEIEEETMLQVIEATSATPAEAVAGLWLALNKDKDAKAK